MIEDEKKEKDVEEVRREKLTKLRSQGFNFPNSFRRSHLSRELINEHGEKRAEELVREAIKVGVAGRIVLKRMMGKASFIHIQDNLGRIQVYVRENDIQDYAAFKDWDLGDIVGIEGELFKTKTGELTIHARVNCLLTKSLKPLPDKFHGLIEKEMCYRKRYVDLIANEETRNIFLTRIKVIKEIRIFIEEHDFLEVETPMMHPIPGGAVAKPFVTHHHALDKPMFLRIAPELYLKRLVVGGFEKVFEINRNFRNEGLSTRHNPEFTMMEFYEAYADYKDLMELT